MKLPTKAPKTAQLVINNDGNSAIRRISAAHSSSMLDNGTHLEDRQVHRNDQSTNENAENRHDQRL